MAEWDGAFAHTLGREAINPRPVGEAQIHNVFAPLSAGFLSYSDGAHDDVNKAVWSMCGWDPSVAVDDILADYARFFFGPDVAEDAADGILALEQNWVGPVAGNVVIADTLALWEGLEAFRPDLATNWRWQMCLLRANYDAFIQERLAYETTLEAQADVALASASSVGADVAMASAQAALDLADTAPVRPDLRARIVSLCDDLFNSIGLQTSVPLYSAKNYERGCVLDFVDHPLNDRWWYENIFAEAGAMATEQEKLDTLDDLILHWEDPGPGGFYDDLGNLTKQPHLVQRSPWADDPGRVDSTKNGFIWHNGSRSYDRGGGPLSWQNQAETLYGTPVEMHYEGLDPLAQYRVKLLYFGRYWPTMTLTADGTHEIHGALASAIFPPPEYDIPIEATADGELDLAWDLVDGRGCQVAEVWLMKSGPAVTVTAPNGGESWERGSTYDITWTSTGVVNDVYIRLEKGTGETQWLAYATPNDGTFSWKVPYGQTPASDYRIAIYFYDGVTWPGDTSNATFTIAPGDSTTVTAPNGGETWQRGTQYGITWSSTGAVGNVYLRLEKGGVEDHWIACDIPNTGSYSWRIPYNQTPAGDYRVGVYFYNGVTWLGDTSDADFTIGPGDSVTLTAPNGGESWASGTQHDITWTSTGTVGSVYLRLEKGGVPQNWIACGIANTGLVQLARALHPSRRYGLPHWGLLLQRRHVVGRHERRRYRVHRRRFRHGHVAQRRTILGAGHAARNHLDLDRRRQHRLHPPRERRRRGPLDRVQHGQYRLVPVDRAERPGLRYELPHRRVLLHGIGLARRYQQRRFHHPARIPDAHVAERRRGMECRHPTRSHLDLDGLRGQCVHPAREGRRGGPLDRVQTRPTPARTCGRFRPDRCPEPITA